ncbi:MAG: oxygen-independent coproporphyrinogen III oxidase [Verrucomicrobiota bacterium JB022]|nr:oxygen-independent coproporphyrinogen III oxidase [Verrucomicrobiota bacterium JB022]
MLPRALVEKYQRPGPRYTSYPTALHFTDKVEPATLIADAVQQTGPRSLYFHLPFCESLCWFCACAKVITKDTSRADRYLQALERELDLYVAATGAERPVEQLHLGGGSPSFFTVAQLARLMELVRQRFTYAPDAELSVELDPRTVDAEKIAVLAETGFRRASFGVQDVEPKVQEAIHRIQPSEMNRQCIEQARAAGFNSVNIDLIYGLPEQTPQSWTRTLDEVLTYQPDRLAIFAYAHVPWSAPAQKILERKTPLPETEERLAMLERANERLLAAGYAFIGMDHYALPDDELAVAQREGTLHRNFQGYSTRAGREIAGFGMSAISQTSGSFRQNVKDLKGYYAAVEGGSWPVDRGYLLTDDDQIRRHAIMEVMCHGRLQWADLKRAYGIQPLEYFQRSLPSLAEMEQDGLLTLTPAGLEVTDIGWRLLRNIAMTFDAYLKPEEKRHARTI